MMGLALGYAIGCLTLTKQGRAIAQNTVSTAHNEAMKMFRKTKTTTVAKYTELRNKS